MRPEHKQIQRKIKKAWDSKYKVLIEVKKQNQLPSEKNGIYRPDVLVRSKRNNKEILHIIEVENDPMRKAIVGAVILANYCIKELKQKTKPRFTFVVYSKNGRKQLKSFDERCKIVKPYAKRLSKIKVIPVTDLKIFLKSFGKKP